MRFAPRHRFSVIEREATVNDQGEPTYADRAVATVAVDLRPIAGREHRMAARVHEETTYEGLARYTDRVKPRHVLRGDSQEFEIVAAFNVEMQSQFLRLELKEHGEVV